jgi:hypothetical protein
MCLITTIITARNFMVSMAGLGSSFLMAGSTIDSIMTLTIALLEAAVSTEDFAATEPLRAAATCAEVLPMAAPAAARSATAAAGVTPVQAAMAAVATDVKQPSGRL